MHAAPMARRRGSRWRGRAQLEGRLLAILDSRVKRSRPGRWSLAAAMLAAVAVTAPLATVRAQSQAAQAVAAGRGGDVPRRSGAEESRNAGRIRERVREGAPIHGSPEDA